MKKLAIFFIQAVLAPAVLSAGPALAPPVFATQPSESPDGHFMAYVEDGNLFVSDKVAGTTTQFTFDGTDLIMNGCASWVYFEEVFGRPSSYNAFWWSPDSQTVAFYRFDDTDVPYFPIYSAKGQYGELLNTRYPKAGTPNPGIKLGFASLATGAVTWADLPYDECYLGSPFWRDDSQVFYVPRQPRLQNELDIYSVNPFDGSASNVYHESYKTWVEWPSSMIFTKDGLYTVRNYETGWEQIYYLDLTGKSVTRLTDAHLWNTTLLGRDRKGNIIFTSKLLSTVRFGVYALTPKGEILPLTPSDLNAAGVTLAKDASSFTAVLSNCSTPNRKSEFKLTHKGGKLTAKETVISQDTLPANLSRREIIYFTTSDGVTLPATITYPHGFDPEAYKDGASNAPKYPVVCEVYGGPGTAYVRDRFSANAKRAFFAENGIITVTMDSRVAGHNGREGLDCVYKDFTTKAIEDFLEWAAYLGTLPYVDAGHIGIEGFSFGGTMTAMMVLRHSDVFCCGIAGGGVYDWHLYDTNYTERFMQTPELNPEGYDRASVLNYVNEYPCSLGTEPRLMLTHGTGDDNVHFQNFLQLAGKLQDEGKEFEMMIYPDGKHGYRGAQNTHDIATAGRFWLKHLKNNE